MAEPLLTTGEVAIRLHVSTATVARLVKDGTLTPVRVGGSVRFRPEDIEAMTAPAPTDGVA